MIDVLSYPSPDWSNRPSRKATRKALDLNERGRVELDGGRLEEAERLFMQSVQTVPLIAMPWFNLGLVYKRQLRWPESAACNQRSVDLGANEQDPAFWNLGIAATALRDWQTARRAWSGYGIELEPGTGPIEMDFGPSPVRINPAGNAEVVWGRRIDPTRILIENIPLPGSGHRWRDIVLHDGEPKGQRSLGEHTFSVFDEILRWRASSIPTAECMVVAPTTAIQNLSERFQTEGWALEDWTSNLRMLCKTCSEGFPDSHAHGAFPSDAAGNHVGVAAPEQIATRLLDDWLSEVPGSTRTDLVPLED
ncbi:MAG: tetratricopeptide repeat protein [bacterium]|nr:tetratricopeptide repeat protein [bacterium]